MDIFMYWQKTINIYIMINISYILHMNLWAWTWVNTQTVPPQEKQDTQDVFLLEYDFDTSKELVEKILKTQEKSWVSFEEVAQNAQWIERDSTLPDQLLSTHHFPSLTQEQLQAVKNVHTSVSRWGYKNDFLSMQKMVKNLKQQGLSSKQIRLLMESGILGKIDPEQAKILSWLIGQYKADAFRTQDIIGDPSVWKRFFTNTMSSWLKKDIFCENMRNFPSSIRYIFDDLHVFQQFLAFPFWSSEDKKHIFLDIFNINTSIIQRLILSLTTLQSFLESDLENKDKYFILITCVWYDDTWTQLTKRSDIKWLISDSSLSDEQKQAILTLIDKRWEQK